ncbi:site-specific DNA-methyltransferase [Sphingorhabdus arenilitoris]|uniref:site-specific DNA-methyltransferase (adenine-specific) n=1 Tax=Sphingorhabdus arenilitoris TaxID=1490041 RepID=A0ABV8RDJ8_9SPHN
MTNAQYQSKKPARNLSYQPTNDLKPLARNARTHSRKQIQQIADSINRFGFNNPVLVDDGNQIVAGHGRVAAAKLLGMAEVPVVALSGMSAAERKAYALADNKLALNAGWDVDLLALELQELIDLDFEVELTGFSLAEIDFTLEAANDGAQLAASDEADTVPPRNDTPVTKAGDIWQLGKHLLLCGDARSDADYCKLMAGLQAAMIFTDPPYNVPIDGHVSGLGNVKHREFAMAAGEMSVAQFTDFLSSTLTAMSKQCRSGTIIYVCMDWRHMRELLDAGEAANLELKNLCVWNKTNGGMGAFYRSKHELVFVFKHGDAPHVNSFGLGETGRYRTNVWDYAGISSISATRKEELEMHPTVKPVAMIADAIKDCSRRGEIILDPFGGSGSTLIAAQQAGRIARLIELDPLYCDTIVRRFEAYTGQQAVHTESGQSFEQRLDCSDLLLNAEVN